jgi:hypothetical protein
MESKDVLDTYLTLNDKSATYAWRYLVILTQTLVLTAGLL